MHKLFIAVKHILTCTSAKVQIDLVKRDCLFSINPSFPPIVEEKRGNEETKCLDVSICQSMDQMI